MKKVKICGVIISIMLIIYVILLCYISTKMNNHPYKIYTSTDQTMYNVTLSNETKQIYVPITIENRSNRLISTRNNISMSYHLYKIDDNQNQTLVSWDNPLTNIDDVFNNEIGVCNVALTIPEKNGLYIYYIDILETGKLWFSENGVLTIPVTVEVK